MLDVSIGKKRVGAVFRFESASAKKLMKDERSSNGNEVIIADCKEGLKRILRVRIQHCFREANKCADALARRGAACPNDFVIFQIPPADVALLASLDAAGTLYERSCSSASTSATILPRNHDSPCEGNCLLK
ncbi:hypothetical protein SO802_029999 [Lithocarpus litseifolius]|uniref:RNase H type-1 domain-containing protein n=1 Tax=Lithocarpus litseifolius TaxID=425828 RepID=A0AAW2C0B4_9ROSI